MKRFLVVLALIALFAGIGAAQRKRLPPKKTPPPAAKGAAAPDINGGKVSGRTYTNTKLGFEITFPDMWLIPDSDFEDYMKKKGFDLSLKPPDSLPISSKVKISHAIKQVNILLTAYRSMPGSADNAIVRISVEDLSANPQIKDAVDYFDAIRAMYGTMNLPADFKYSETQAEKLGSMQFGYLDATSSAGKKRMYAVVRNGFAVQFTLTYTNSEDLATMRGVLAGGNFHLQ